MNTIVILLCAAFLCQVHPADDQEKKTNEDESIFRTLVTTKNVRNNTTPDKKPYRGSYIDVTVLDKPHNLFIGRCSQYENELHREHVILNNDGKSHVSGNIRINVHAPVDITCVKVTDEAPGSGAYPSYIGGGVGFNFVEIGVITKYGHGFKFFLQIFGSLKEKDKKNESS